MKSKFQVAPGKLQPATYFLLFTSYFLLGCGLVIKDPLSVLAAEHRGSPAVTFSRAEAIEELDALARMLDRVHRDPYRFHSRDVVDAERRRLIDTMPASLSQTELCLRLSRLLATVLERAVNCPAR